MRKKIIRVPNGTPAYLKPYFKNIIKELQTLKLENSADNEIIYNLAVQYYRRDMLISTLADEGETYTDKHGNIRINPSSKLLNDIIGSIIRMQIELGLNPKARAMILKNTKREPTQFDLEKILK